MNDPSLGKIKGNKNKKIIVKPEGYYDSDLSVSPENLKKNELEKFVSLVNNIKDEIDLVYINPLEIASIDKEKAEAFKGKLIFNSESADYVIVDSNADSSQKTLTHTSSSPSLSSASASSNSSSSTSSSILLDKNSVTSKYGIYKKVKSNEDIHQIKDYLVSNKLSFVIIDLEDWRIIPLENIIASLQSKINRNICCCQIN